MINIFWLSGGIMYCSGIDQHNLFSVITTVNDDGIIIKQAELKNNGFDILNYFFSIGKDHCADDETTGGWYWLKDLLSSNGINLKLAYVKVKTDRVNSSIFFYHLTKSFFKRLYRNLLKKWSVNTRLFLCQ